MHSELILLKELSVDTVETITERSLTMERTLTPRWEVNLDYTVLMDQLKCRKANVRVNLAPRATFD